MDLASPYLLIGRLHILLDLCLPHVFFCRTVKVIDNWIGPFTVDKSCSCVFWIFFVPRALVSPYLLYYMRLSIASVNVLISKCL
jgi:hypothetical protein